MNKTVMIFLSSVMFVLVAGCKEETKSVDWYSKHPDKMKEISAACDESGDDTQNCKNAKQARFNQQQYDAPIPHFDDFGKETEKYEKFYKTHPDEAKRDNEECKNKNLISEKCDAAFQFLNPL